MKRLMTSMANLTMTTAVILMEIFATIPCRGQNQAKDQYGLQATLEEILSDPALSQASVSLCVMKPDGTGMAEINPEKMLVPASNMKLITTGAALHKLGGEYRYTTYIGHDGIISGNTLKGNLYIIGGGDPTTGSTDSIATGTVETFAKWERILKDAGIKRIEGHIIGDGRWLEGMAEESSWTWSDIGTYYGTGVTGLMFYENMLSFNVSAADSIGKAPHIFPDYPKTPWMDFHYECTTGRKGTGDRLYMYTSSTAPTAKIIGSFAIDKPDKRVDFSNKFPEYTCAVLFEKHLKSKGIICQKGAADTRLRTVPLCPEEQIRIIGEVSSPNLKKIAFQTNHESNNLFAETLFRTLGKQLRASATYDSSYVAINDILKEMKINLPQGINIRDGSGLSRQNLLSAGFICSFLKAMTTSASFEDYIYTLPSPGGNGSLQYNMQGYPAELKNRIKAKSGSMEGVRCYSGYIQPSQGGMENMLIFSVMVNNCITPTWKVRALLDKIMAAIAAAI